MLEHHGNVSLWKRKCRLLCPNSTTMERMACTHPHVKTQRDPHRHTRQPQAQRCVQGWRPRNPTTSWSDGLGSGALQG